MLKEGVEVLVSDAVMITPHCENMCSLQTEWIASDRICHWLWDAACCDMQWDVMNQIFVYHTSVHMHFNMVWQIIKRRIGVAKSSNFLDAFAVLHICKGRVYFNEMIYEDFPINSLAFASLCRWFLCGGTHVPGLCARVSLHYRPKITWCLNVVFFLPPSYFSGRWETKLPALCSYL